MTQLEVDWQARTGRFQQRIAEIVAQYETDIMLLREQYEAEIKRLTEENKNVVSRGTTSA